MAALKALAHSAIWPKALIVILLTLGLSMKWTAVTVVIVVVPFLVHIYRKGRSEQFHEDPTDQAARLRADDRFNQTVRLSDD